MAESLIADVNEATVKVTGVLREALVGTTFSGYFTDPDRANRIYTLVVDQETAVDYPLSIGVRYTPWTPTWRATTQQRTPGPRTESGDKTPGGDALTRPTSATRQPATTVPLDRTMPVIDPLVNLMVPACWAVRGPEPALPFPAMMLQYGVMLAHVLALTARGLLHTAQVRGPGTTSRSFSVWPAFGVLVGVFALLLALMILGGHLRVSFQRKRLENRR